MSRCQLCDGRHPGHPEDCAEVRTGPLAGGKYELDRLLGVGGMAAVYAARHTLLKRDVAIKILHKRYSTDRELSSRLVREARETAAMDHPGFVHVHDAGVSEDGCAFVEMECLVGRDLYTVRTEQGALAPERVTTIAIAVLDALAALHARDVIHRDLKSSNIYLCATPAGGEAVKLLDLGFAKVADEMNLTAKNQLLGTPFYMSPEQCIDPTTVDERTDLFALGVVMFEVLTGEWPYAYASKKELLGKVVKGELDRNPARRRAELPQWLDLIVARALAHDRTRRFPSAVAMRTALEEASAPAPAKRGLLQRLFRR